MTYRHLSAKILHYLENSFGYILYKGNKYTCPFCNHSSKKLGNVGMDLPVIKEKEVVGAGKRLGKCFKCGSRDRERLIYAYLWEEVQIYKNKEQKILHIAPEKFLSTKLLQLDFEEYTCGDLFVNGYSYPTYVQTVDIEKMPFECNHYDWVICNHVLEHVEDDKEAMKEIFRVLKKGGKAILQVPIALNLATTFENPSIISPKEREQKFGQFDHYRLYGRDYVERLSNSGFAVKKINISEKYAHYGVQKKEDLYICTK